MSARHLKVFLDLNRAQALVSRRFDAELGGVHGLALKELQLLLALENAPDQRLRRIDLAQELGLTASGVTWMLRPLAKRRLVTSEASEEDARASFAVLTEAGMRLVAEALPTARELAADLVKESLLTDELGVFAEGVSRLSSPSARKK